MIELCCDFLHISLSHSYKARPDLENCDLDAFSTVAYFYVDD